MEVSHIWLGNFGREAPTSYFEEQHSAEDAPISRFALEQGERWYDHDWLEVSYLEAPCEVRALVAPHSYSGSYLELVTAKAASLGISEVNVFVLADADLFSHPRSVSGPGYQLWYIGKFECDIG